MDISVKALLISTVWALFWLFVSSAMEKGDPVKWKQTRYGTFPATMFFCGIVGICGSVIWFVVRL